MLEARVVGSYRSSALSGWPALSRCMHRSCYIRVSARGFLTRLTRSMLTDGLVYFVALTGTSRRLARARTLLTPNMLSCEHRQPHSLSKHGQSIAGVFPWVRNHVVSDSLCVCSQSSGSVPSYSPLAPLAAHPVCRSF